MNTKKGLRLFAVIMIVLIGGYYIIGFVSSYIGWYGYKKWEYRMATTDVEESKKRGVFVKELNFKIDSAFGSLENFRPYIEKGFKYGRHSSEETALLTGSNYPYQLNYSFNNSSKVSILINETESNKLDSCNKTMGYLKSPHLRDTVVVDVVDENRRFGQIKDMGITHWHLLLFESKILIFPYSPGKCF